MTSASVRPCVAGWLRVLLLAASAVAAVPLDVRAATIQLTILSIPYVSADGLRVQLDIRNNGDAPARSLMPFVAFRGADMAGTLVTELGPSRSSRQTVVVPLGGQPLRGAWPIFVRLSYADANNHPFEALHIAAASFGAGGAAAEAPPPGPVRLDLSGVELTTTGTITARLDSAVDASVSVTFVVPAGLAVTPDSPFQVALKPGTRRLSAFLTNTGATDASSLPVFAVAEYESQGVHQTTIATAHVGIVPERESLARPLLAAAFVALVVAWVGIAIRSRRRRHARG